VQRTNYSLAGQAIGLRIVGSPDGDNGLYYMHTDHLGSTSTLSILKDDGTAPYVPDSRALYEPFGDYRLEPTGEYTDRGYTGHLGNNSGSNDIGLIYMNARFFVPSVARFASADTIVPDMSNPQAFNRYSYVANNPLKYIDPSGHCWGFASGLRNNSVGASVCNGIDGFFQDAQEWWVNSNPCGMSIDPACNYSVPTNASSAVDDILQSQLLLISPEEATRLREITQITDTALRLANLMDFFQPIFTSSNENLYTKENIDGIQSYLESDLLDDAYSSEFAPYNIAMVERQRAIMRGEIEPTTYDLNWMHHELAEYSLRQSGMSYDEAHALAIEMANVGGDWDLWPTAIIQEYPEWLIGPDWQQPIDER
jgi:RHS repeat-associated protein